MHRALPLLVSSALSLPLGALADAAKGTLIIQGAPDGETVIIDGAAVGQIPLPGPWTIEAGSHEVKIGARTQTVQVQAGKQVAVAYGAAPAPPPTVTKAEPPKAVTAGERFPVATAGYVGAGVGLAAIGAGVFFSLQSSDDPSEAERSAVLANICYGMGGVLLAGGAAMIIWGSDGPFSASATPGGAVIGGRF